MIPNICWTLTVHDGIKPIRLQHPRAGVLWLSSMCETHQLQLYLPADFPVDRFSPPLSAQWSLLPFELSRLPFKEQICWWIKDISNIGKVLNTDSDHLEAFICIFKFASGRVLWGYTVLAALCLNYLIQFPSSAKNRWSSKQTIAKRFVQ